MVAIVGRRWLRAGRSAHLAGYEAQAVRRAAKVLERSEAAWADGQATRAAARAPVFVSPEAEFAAGLIADIAQSAPAAAGRAG